MGAPQRLGTYEPPPSGEPGEEEAPEGLICFGGVGEAEVASMLRTPVKLAWSEHNPGAKALAEELAAAVAGVEAVPWRVAAAAAAEGSKKPSGKSSPFDDFVQPAAGEEGKEERGGALRLRLLLLNARTFGGRRRSERRLCAADARATAA